MINLLPPKGHTALTHEYVLRVGAMYATILAGVFIANCALLIPTYVLTSTQLKAVRTESSSMDETRAAFDAAFGEIKVANTVMAQLRTDETRESFTPIIEEIVKNAPHGITFITFQSTQGATGIETIQVQGVAQNRNTLASFKNALEATETVKSATIPISDLARETDLPFVVTITLEGKPASTP